ncbi:hypothetical protein DENSPDRAFT_933680 [Dentipellis sp. KUC8613]|nr:hypothetical protein DENSPDRAFT_933680 [Dentipellis sp. KUC8613]
MTILAPLVRELNSTVMLASWQSVPPVYRLSQDVLQYIWEMGTWESDSGKENIIFPLKVSQVCRSWRALAIATPTLWTVISLLGEHQGSDYFQQQQSLARSKNCSLTVFVDLGYVQYDENESGIYTYDTLDSSFPSLAHIARLLKPHVSRIQTFTVLADDNTIAYFFLRRTGRQDMPKLKCLDVMVDTSNGFNGFSMPQIQDSLDLLPQECAPALKSLSLSGVHLFWPSTLYTGLTSLTISHMDLGQRPSTHELGELLSSTAQSLEYLELRDADPSDWEDAPVIHEEDRIVLPNVLELVLGYSRPEGAALVLKLFHYPKMQKLTMRDMEYDFSDDDSGRILGPDASCVMRALTAQNSLPSVDFLVLQGMCMPSTDNASKLLNAFHALKTLEINGCSSSFLQALALAPPVAFELSEHSPTSVLPSLLCLSLRNLSIIDMEYRKVVKMLRTRKAAGEKAHVPKFDYLSVVWDRCPFVVDVRFPSRLLAYSIDVYYVDVPAPKPFRPWSARWGVAPRSALWY